MTEGSGDPGFYNSFVLQGATLSTTSATGIVVGEHADVTEATGLVTTNSLTVSGGDHLQPGGHWRRIT